MSAGVEGAALSTVPVVYWAYFGDSMSVYLAFVSV